MNTSDLRMFSCSLRACSLASFALHSSTRTEKKCYMLLLYRPKPQVKPCCPKIINTTQQISSQTNSTTQLTRHALTVTHLFCMSLGTHVHLVYIYIYLFSHIFVHIVIEFISLAGPTQVSVSSSSLDCPFEEPVWFFCRAPLMRAAIQPKKGQ